MRLTLPLSPQYSAVAEEDFHLRRCLPLHSTIPLPFPSAGGLAVFLPELRNNSRQLHSTSNENGGRRRGGSFTFPEDTGPTLHGTPQFTAEAIFEGPDRFLGTEKVAAIPRSVRSAWGNISAAAAARREEVEVIPGEMAVSYLSL